MVPPPSVRDVSHFTRGELRTARAPAIHAYLALHHAFMRSNGSALDTVVSLIRGVPVYYALHSPTFICNLLVVQGRGETKIHNDAGVRYHPSHLSPASHPSMHLSARSGWQTPHS